MRYGLYKKAVRQSLTASSSDFITNFLIIGQQPKQCIGIIHSQEFHLPLHAGCRPCDVWDSAGVSLQVCSGHGGIFALDTQSQYLSLGFDWLFGNQLICKLIYFPIPKTFHGVLFSYRFPFPAEQLTYFAAEYKFFKVLRDVA